MESIASRLTLNGFYSTVLIRFSGEIGIKSIQVRRRLLDRLIINIKNQLVRKHIPGYDLDLTHARFFLHFPDTINIAAVNEFLQLIPGIHSFSYCVAFPLSMDGIFAQVTALGKLLLKEGITFAVRVTREGKHEFTSQELAAKVGEHVLEAFLGIHARVNLTDPTVTFFLEVRDDRVLLYHEKHSGLGGLPRDVSSPVLGSIGLVDRSWNVCSHVLKRGANLHLVLIYDFGKKNSNEIRIPEKLVEKLNDDSILLDHLFGLLDYQEDNRVQLSVVPLSGGFLDYCSAMLLSIRDPVVAAFLQILILNLINASERIDKEKGDEKASDFKAIVSEFNDIGQDSVIGLRWMHHAGEAVEAMLPAGVKALPLLFPSIVDSAPISKAQGITSGNTPPNCAAGTLMDIMQRSTTRDDFKNILYEMVQQRRIINFDLVQRHFIL
nr:THUMP domain-containing protein [Candidatus Sigynarchaeota archaeon]